MKRLTGRAPDGTAYLYNMGGTNEAIDRLAAYEDTGLEPEDVEHERKLNEAIRKAQMEHLLIVLPCKVGDTLYAPTRNFVSTFRVSQFDYGGYERPYLWVNWYLTDGITGNFRTDGISGGEIGHTVFLTREEAEAALRKEQGNG